MPGRTPAALGDIGLARGYALGLGALLVMIGFAGFLDNPLVGDPDGGPFLVTGTVHDMLHLATGFLALYIAFATVGRGQADAVIAFGALYVAIVVVTWLSPNLFGILGPSPGYNVNLPGHVLHLAIGVASVAVGVIARRRMAVADGGIRR